MKDEHLTQELREIEHKDRAELDSLARAVEEKTREMVREAVKIWLGAGPETKRARMVALLLAELQDLSIVPLIEVKNPPTNLQRVWRMNQVVEAQLELRKDIVAMLDRMLDDKTIINYPADEGPIEEEPPDERICDAAYIQMRRLIYFGESPEEYQLNTSLFLDLEFEERDQEINKYRESETWTQLFD